MDRGALGKPLVFVSDNNGNVDIFLQRGKKAMVGRITGLTLSTLATDSAGDLYVADVLSNNLIVYAPPYTKGPKLKFTAGREPQDVAVSREGIIAVTTCTIPSGSQCGAGVLFYAAGSTTPCATVLVDPSTFSGGLFGAAFDHKGNLYVDGYNLATKAAVAAKIDGGCKAKRATTLAINNTIAYPISIRVDKSGRIAILDAPEYKAVIDTYNPPTGGSLGTPVSTTTLSVPTYAGDFTFRASGGHVWVDFQSLGPSYGSAASEYAYPSGSAPGRTVMGDPSSAPGGVAVTPPLVP
ncbi:MAG TPA: hypothetical protein VIW73_01820 [Candidatus Cybelea sp.]